MQCRRHAKTGQGNKSLGAHERDEQKKGNRDQRHRSNRRKPEREQECNKSRLVK